MVTATEALLLFLSLPFITATFVGVPVWLQERRETAARQAHDAAMEATEAE